MTIKNDLKIGTVLSYLQMALSIIIGLVYTPMMIRLLGKSEYGLYNVVSSTVTMLSILSLGFNSGYVRYYAKYKKDEDNLAIFRLNGLFLVIFFVIGMVALFCGIFLSFNLSIVFANGLTPSEYELAKVLMIILTVNLAISFPMSVFQNIISAHEKFVFLKLVGTIRTVLSPLVTLPLLLLGYRSIALVIVTTCVSIVVDIFYFCFVKFRLKQKFVFQYFDKGLLKSLIGYTFFIAIHIVVDQINWNVDKAILGRFKGTEVVAIYSVGFTLHQYFSSFASPVSSIFIPRVHTIINNTVSDVERQRKELTALFIKLGRIQFIILSLILTGMIFFGRPFISYWAGPEYVESFYVFLLLAVPAIVDLIQSIGTEIQRGLNKHKFRAIAYLITAIANIVISVFLCQIYGAVGSAIGTALSFIIVQGIVVNIYYHKQCNLNILLFWKNILRVSCGLIIPIIIGIFMSRFLDLFTIPILIVSVLLYSSIYCASMWFFGMNNYERSIIKKPINRLFKKKHIV